MPSYPFPPGAGGGGGGGGGGAATSFQLLAADPGAPSNSQVWYNTTDERFRGHEAGVTIDFAAEKEIDVQLYPGADFGEKLQNAHDDLPANGGVLNCEGLTDAQTISSTVTITKKVKVILGAMTCAVSVSPGIFFQKSSGDETFSSGSNMTGAGWATLFSASAGVAPIIRVEADDVTLQDFKYSFAGANAANQGIYVGPVTGPYTLRARLLRIRGLGNSDTGSGLVLGNTYVGSIRDCFFQNFNQGLLCDASSPSQHAYQIEACRFHSNNYGIDVQASGTLFLVNNTIEGNAVWGLRNYKGFGISSFGNHWENQGASGGNVNFEDPADAFKRTHTFTAEQWVVTSPTGSDIVSNASSTNEVQVFGGLCSSGFTTTSTGRIILWGVDVSLGTVTLTGNIIQHGRTFQEGLSSVAYQVSGWQSYQFLNAVTFNPDGDATSDVRIEGDTDPNLFFADVSVDAIAIGTGTASPFYKVIMTSARTETSGTVGSVQVQCDINPGGPTTGVYNAFSIIGFSRTANVENFTTIDAANFSAEHRGTGTVTTLRGLYARADNVSATGTVTTAFGLAAQIINASTGTITTGRALYVATPTNNGTMVTYEALFIEDPAGAASVNRAIRTRGGDCIFNDVLGAYDFQIKGDTDANLFYLSGQYNSISIGGSPPSSTQQRLAVTRTGALETSGNVFGLNVTLGVDPAGASTAANRGVLITAFTQAANAQTFTTLVGQTVTVDHRGTDTVSDERGIEANINVTSTGTVTSTAGLRVVTTNSVGGTITNLTGLFLQVANPTGTVTTTRNIWITAPTTGTWGTWIGINIDEPTATVTTKTAIQTQGGNIILNELGGAYSVRTETDNVINAFVVDGTSDAVAFGRTVNTTSFVGITQPAYDSGSATWPNLRMLDAIAGAHVGLPASTETHDVYLDLSRSVNWATGALATQRAFYVDAPTYSVTAGVSQVITTAATFAISGAPVAAADGTTITNAYSFWVQTGRVQLDGTLAVVGSIGFFTTAPQAQQVSGANLTNNVTVGGTDNVIDDVAADGTIATAADLVSTRNAVYQLARKQKQINDGLRVYGLFT